MKYCKRKIIVDKLEKHQEEEKEIQQKKEKERKFEIACNFTFKSKFY